ncbi:hypothetical protein J3459_011991 [Metarhizium acridum]|nr:hypothetical protein J3459_011991 [Metarhizium acridum]
MRDTCARNGHGSTYMYRLASNRFTLHMSVVTFSEYIWSPHSVFRAPQPIVPKYSMSKSTSICHGLLCSCCLLSIAMTAHVPFRLILAQLLKLTALQPSFVSGRNQPVAAFDSDEQAVGYTQSQYMM